MALGLAACSSGSNDADNDTTPPDDTAPIETTTVQGQVINGPLVGAEVLIYDAEGNLLGSAITDENGDYVLDVPANPPYRLVTQGGELDGQPYQGSMQAWCETANPCTVTPFSTALLAIMDAMGLSASEARAHLAGLLGFDSDPFGDTGLNSNLFQLNDARTALNHGAGLQAWVNSVVAWAQDQSQPAPAGVPEPQTDPDPGTPPPPRPSYTVSAHTTEGGRINPDSQSVRLGNSAGFTITPDPGYQIDSVSGCNGTMSGANYYITGAIFANCTVTASFSLNSYTVTPSVTAGGGSISPDTAQTANHGGTVAFTLTPDANYLIDTIGGTCGGSLDTHTYTTNAITANCTVQASFTLPAPTNLMATAGNEEVTLSWTAVTGATDYCVYTSDSSGIHPDTAASYDSRTCTGNTDVSHTVTGLTNDTAYYFIVTASDGSVESAASNDTTPPDDTAPIENTTVQGQVVNGPLAGAEVLIYDAEGNLLGSATTDENGDYVLDVPANPPYRIVTQGGLLNGVAYQGSLQAWCEAASPCTATPYTTLLLALMDATGFNYGDALALLLQRLSTGDDPFLAAVPVDLFDVDASREELQAGVNLDVWVDDFVAWINNPELTPPAGIPAQELVQAPTSPPPPGGDEEGPEVSLDDSDPWGSLATVIDSDYLTGSESTIYLSGQMLSHYGTFSWQIEEYPGLSAPQGAVLNQGATFRFTPALAGKYVIELAASGVDEATRFVLFINDALPFDTAYIQGGDTTPLAYLSGYIENQFWVRYSGISRSALELFIATLPELSVVGEHVDHGLLVEIDMTQDAGDILHAVQALADHDHVDATEPRYFTGSGLYAVDQLQGGGLDMSQLDGCYNAATDSINEDDCFHLEPLDMVPAWENYTTGSNAVRVVVVDVGFGDTSGDTVTFPVDNRLRYQLTFVGFNDERLQELSQDDRDHGEMVAGVIAAEAGNGEGYVGINWQSRVIPSLMPGSCVGDGDEALVCMRGSINVDPRVRVTNLSWGSMVGEVRDEDWQLLRVFAVDPGTGPRDWNDDDWLAPTAIPRDNIADCTATAAAFEFCMARDNMDTRRSIQQTPDVLFVKSAGNGVNNGGCLDLGSGEVCGIDARYEGTFQMAVQQRLVDFGIAPSPFLVSTMYEMRVVHDPLDNLLVVGAACPVDDDGWALCYYSAFGEVVDIVAPVGFKAPAAQQSTGFFGFNRQWVYKEATGTSTAAPVVSGIASLIYSIHPDFTPAEVKQILLDSADRIEVEERCIQWDCNTREALTHKLPMVNAERALSLAVQRAPRTTQLVPRRLDTPNNAASEYRFGIDLSNLPHYLRGKTVRVEYGFGDGATGFDWVTIPASGPVFLSIGHTYNSAGFYGLVVAAKLATGETFAQGDLLVEVGVVPELNNVGFDYQLEPSNDGFMTIAVDASQIVASDVDPIVRYIWNWGDGTPNRIADNPVSTHEYQQSGSYIIELEIITESGAVTHYQQLVAVEDEGAIERVDYLTPIPGDTQVTLTWTPPAQADSYTLYYGMWPGVHPDVHSSYDASVSIPGSAQSYTVTGLNNDTEYYFTLTVIVDGQESAPSNEAAAIPRESVVGTGRPLNDTGITLCGNYAFSPPGTGSNHSNSLNCSDVGATATAAGVDIFTNPVPPGQDAHFGRDAQAMASTLTKTGGGSAGFDFTKVCNSGELAGEGTCPASPALGGGNDEWACTLDNVTGLMWEVKVNDITSMHHMNHTFNWYNSDPVTNGGFAGTASGGSCNSTVAAGCDTEKFVAAVNDLGGPGLCGHKDWRMPDSRELLSIVHNDRVSPAIDTGWFPNTPSSWFWSSSPYASYTDYAWFVDFFVGNVDWSYKVDGNRVRLVRAGQ